MVRLKNSQIRKNHPKWCTPETQLGNTEEEGKLLGLKRGSKPQIFGTQGRHLTNGPLQWSAQSRWRDCSLSVNFSPKLIYTLQAKWLWWLFLSILSATQNEWHTEKYTKSRIKSIKTRKVKRPLVCQPLSICQSLSVCPSLSVPTYPYSTAEKKTLEAVSTIRLKSKALGLRRLSSSFTTSSENPLFLTFSTRKYALQMYQ